MSFIYHIADKDGDCIYIGQSNQTREQRMTEHIKGAWPWYSDTKTQAAQIIQNNFLFDIDFRFYEDDWFGLTPDNYIKFIALFSDQPNTQLTLESLQARPQTKLDIAEILHILFFTNGHEYAQVLNKQMGGGGGIKGEVEKRQQWYFADTNIPAFFTTWSPQAFNNFLQNREKIKSFITEGFNQSFKTVLDNKKNRDKIIFETKKHMEKHKTKTLNWQELKNTGNVYFTNLNNGLQEAVASYLRDINQSFNQFMKTNNILNIEINMNLPFLEQQLYRILAAELQAVVAGKKSDFNIKFDASFAIAASLKIKKTDIKSPDVVSGIAINFTKNSNQELQPLFQKLTCNMFKYVLAKRDLLDPQYYQSFYDKHDNQMKSFIPENLGIEFYNISARHYAANKDLNWIIHQEFLKKLPNVPYVKDNYYWYQFYHEQMNYYMNSLKPYFTYFNYGNKFYAYHITGPTTIQTDEGEAYIATRVPSWGYFDSTKITIY